MSCEQTTAEALKETGHRLTPQRLMILSAIRHAQSHVSAVEITDLVKESYPYIDVSTIYRTLGVLKRMNLVSETDMGGGEYRYEWVEQLGHHHLICRSCDGVSLLDDSFLAGLAAEIFDDHGFQADIGHLAIFGLCEECRGKTDAVNGKTGV